MIQKTQVFKLMGKKSLILLNNQGVISKTARKNQILSDGEPC
ncbi:hypothetical protein MICAK_3710002 [Microcystis aeruginosa PCC 9701]|uniref:Uncharacterized protein n=2 Tax=Microcystis aeruginosa TaxID=1126 RepID=I4IUI6_MICAE|nr:hypothetical protein MICAB_5280009 [Microcystis aeruginosa PCC 9717]CCI37960.1 hypothetical protein MICAK_3710002 [Microcystis aeruginosa PCC 9701]